ncbi:MAG: rhomboid family intramembrane serine protease [Gemmatimonadaceae bacterium]
MIPFGDDLPTVRNPWMTWALLATTLVAWLYFQGGGWSERLLIQSTCNFGMIPGEITHLAPVGSGVRVSRFATCLIDDDAINRFTPLLSIFLHGSWLHLLGNSLYLWIFGNNVEDAMGPWRFLVFYLLCGVAAAAAHVLTNPASPVPTIGASGAISGVLGAYLLLYPKVRVRTWFPPIFFFRVPAWIMLPLWFASQVASGLSQMSPLRPEVTGGVAVWAHVGGFLAGLALIHLFTRPAYLAQIRAARGLAARVWAAE